MNVPPGFDDRPRRLYPVVNEFPGLKQPDHATVLVDIDVRR